MNFLAHAYLSFDDPEVLTGNLISDFVKGKKKYEYPEKILKGIELHRAIDEFTDTHPVNKEAARIFKPVYGLYGPAFLDIVYDHFLAGELDAAKEPPVLRDFTAHSYDQVKRFLMLLPDDFRHVFYYMRKEDWLYNYQFDFGVKKSFEGLVRRAKFMSDAQPAFVLFKENYEELKKAYEIFFPKLRSFSLEKFSDIH